MPRSPSRDLSDRYTGRRGYFRNPDRLRRGKYTLAVMALVAAGAWAAVDVTRSSQAAYAHTHGPLTNPHAAFDDNCAACHTSFSWKDAWSGNILNVRDRWHDFTCSKCHAGADHPPFGHHDSATDAAQAIHNRCSNCHHDHRGRLHSLVRLPDADCTRCHKDLARWFDPAKSRAQPPYENSVTHFVNDHPEFRSLNIATKPRTLTFSHAVHMNPGQTYTPNGKEAMTLARLQQWNGPEIAARYRKPGQSDTDLVQLDCASCHQLDSGIGTKEFEKAKTTLESMGAPTRSLLPARAAGAYFLPINYDLHCRACHPTTAMEGQVTSGDQKFIVPRFDVPHRVQPGQLRSLLKAGYVKELIEGGHPALKEPLEPGGRLDSARPPSSAASLEALANELAQRAEGLLLRGANGCTKCHKTIGDPSHPSEYRIVPVPDRTVWLVHAKFNHAAHRGASCAACHPGTQGREITPMEANQPEPVAILGIDSCRSCHSPAQTRVQLPDGSTIPGGGVRHNCTDCHNYHHGDFPLQGRGSPLRFPKNPRDIADWLRGM
ncbi:MAG: cytochrome c3 family protein [Gemmataceae bacterium]|nr:hypothetical protein [Gemmata sp.]MDW8195974.1 cytochrome c3 family protein [Gemmataceae bacterium]